jgi:hypothetical protein
MIPNNIKEFVEWLTTSPNYYDSVKGYVISIKAVKELRQAAVCKYQDKCEQEQIEGVCPDNVICPIK